jgi:hypothetical protein
VIHQRLYASTAFFFLTIVPLSAQVETVSREVLAITSKAKADTLKSLMTAKISPLTDETRALLATISNASSQSPTSWSIVDMHDALLNIDPSRVPKITPTKDTYIDILLDPTKRFALPEGTFIVPKTLKDLLDGTKGQLVEEKVRVITGMNLSLTPATRLAIEICQPSLRDFTVALGDDAPGSAGSGTATSWAERRVSAQRGLENNCLSVSFQSDAASAFGVLENKQKRVICGALILSAHRIVTAYHCLIQDNTYVEGISLRPLSDPKRLIPLGKPILFPGQERLTELEAARIENDFIGAELASPVTTVPQLCFDHKVSKGDALSIIAYWPLDAMTDGFESSVRTERTGGCLVLTDVGDCFAHSCSTLPGQSGSPIFAAVPGCSGVHIAGLHVAGSTKQVNCGSTETNSAVAASRLSLLLAASPPPLNAGGLK